MSSEFNIIVQGHISILWIQECMKPENQDKSLRQLRSEYAKKTEGVGLINIGTLIQASYLLFVYPKEAIRIPIDINFNLPSFTSEQVQNDDANEFIRTIRNSLSHGNFSILGPKKIVFEDWDYRKGKDKTYRKIEIEFEEFGGFINDYFTWVKRKANPKK